MACDITTVDQLHHYLYVAMQLEHATIPPYLMALYSIDADPKINALAKEHLRSIVVEEMLHLTLAANILNAVGGEPNLTDPGFVPSYPACLPDGEKDFQVDLRPFSHAAIDTFLKIERPEQIPSGKSRLVRRPRGAMSLSLKPPDSDDMHYYSIGEFYAAIADGLRCLHEKMGDVLFPKGREHRQVKREAYYSGGGECCPVGDLDSALWAINLIKDQGEGYDAGVFDDEGELSHFYRFDELKKGKRYKKTDKAGQPSGEELHVDWGAVYPVKVNPRLADYVDWPDLYKLSASFNETYAKFLALITEAYKGKPELLKEAEIQMMTVIKNKMLELIHIPIRGMDCVNAAPTFEMPR